LLKDEEGSSELKTGLKIIVDYRCIMQNTWDIYVALYGGGPLITTSAGYRKKPDAGKWIVAKDEQTQQPVVAKPKRKSSFNKIVASQDAMRGFGAAEQSATKWLHGESGPANDRKSLQSRRSQNDSVADTI
jgi:hypothetical protein